MIDVKGYAAMAAKSPLEPFNFQRRDVGADDVRFKIEYCGICHSDIHQARDEWGGSAFPMVPGHELVGTVIAVGGGVKKFKAGDKVGVGCLVDSCRECDPCKEGLEQFCSKMVVTYNGVDKEGQTTQGGYSTEMVCHQDFVLRIPANIELAKAAPLLCAGITLYSPLRHWKVGKGSKVGIMGLGGLGHMGVQLAAAMGAEVTVFSRSEVKKADALKMGAKEYAAGPDAVKRLAGTLDLIVNTVSAPLDLAPYLGLLKRDGSMVVVGVPDKPVGLPIFPLLVGRRRVAGSLIGGIAETQEMLDFCGKHGIGSWIEVIPMRRVNEAYDNTVAGKVRYRYVIDLASLK
ncbi:MAG: NAD(P)-dependent alcohol dehydrogenase [Elusimicrobiota bacterium]